MNFLSGYKTYLAGAATVIGAVAGYANGQETLVQMFQLIVPAIMLMTTRAAIANK